MLSKLSQIFVIDVVCKNNSHTHTQTPTNIDSLGLAQNIKLDFEEISLKQINI